jgi:hypothetical protein
MLLREIMIADTKEIPDVSPNPFAEQATACDAIQTLRLLIMDACGFSVEEYDHIKEGFMKDLFETKAPAVCRSPQAVPKHRATDTNRS